MPHLMRPPSSPRLRPFVQTLWATVPNEAAPPHPSGREHVLPTGAMHLVFRLSGPPLRIFADAQDRLGSTVGHAIVGGARSSFHARDVSQPTASVGALLHPGVALPLFGAPEGALAARHTPLDALWGLHRPVWRWSASKRLAARLGNSICSKPCCSIAWAAASMAFIRPWRRPWLP
jgi:hypothetical protein